MIETPDVWLRFNRRFVETWSLALSSPIKIYLIMGAWPGCYLILLLILVFPAPLVGNKSAIARVKYFIIIFVVACQSEGKVHAIATIIGEVCIKVVLLSRLLDCVVHVV